MRYVGLDVHKREVEACIVDGRGKIVLRKRFPCTRTELERFAKKELAGECQVALEATSNTWGIVAVLQPLVADLVVSNPLRTRMIAEAKIKTDKVDALVLAQLLRADFLPRVWKPDAHTQSLRSTTTHRAGLIGDRTRIKNRIHALLTQRLIQAPEGDLFAKTGLLWLKNNVELEPDARAFLDAQLNLLAVIDEEIDVVNKALAIGASMDPRAKLLITLPGVDVAVAQTILAALGDEKRFKNGDHAASYLGLVPSTRQTGDHCYNGPITKQGRSHARWMLIQAAQHIGRHPGPLGVFFRRLEKKKDRNIAVVAAARKLIVIAWHMLKNNEPYRYAQPASTETKLARVRVAGGDRRSTGAPLGRSRPESYGSGRRLRTTRSLQAVYEREGLPPTQPPPGEQITIERMQLKGYVDEISRQHKRVRVSKKGGPQHG